MSQASQGSFVTLSMHCTYPCRVDVPGKALFDSLAGTGRQHVKIPLSCFDAPGTLEWDHVNTPFLVYTGGPVRGGVRERPARARRRRRPGRHGLQCADVTMLDVQPLAD